MIRWVSQAYHQYQKSTLSFYFQVSLPLGGQCTSSAGIGTYVCLEVSLKCTQVHPGGYMPTKTQTFLSHFQDSYSPLGVFLVGECYGSISVPSRVWVLKETMLLTNFTWILAQQDKILVTWPLSLVLTKNVLYLVCKKRQPYQKHKNFLPSFLGCTSGFGIGITLLPLVSQHLE